MSCSSGIDFRLSSAMFTSSSCAGRVRDDRRPRGRRAEQRSAGSGGDQATPGGGHLQLRSRAAWEARNCLKEGQEHGTQKGL